MFYEKFTIKTASVKKCMHLIKNRKGVLLQSLQALRQSGLQSQLLRVLALAHLKPGAALAPVFFSFN